VEAHVVVALPAVSVVGGTRRLSDERAIAGVTDELAHVVAVSEEEHVAVALRITVAR